MAPSNPQLRWWVKLAWRLYTPLPPVTGDVHMWGLRYALPFTSLRIPVAIFRGQSRFDRQPGTVVAAGAGDGVNYLIHRNVKNAKKNKSWAVRNARTGWY